MMQFANLNQINLAITLMLHFDEAVAHHCLIYFNKKTKACIVTSKFGIYKTPNTKRDQT